MRRDNNDTHREEHTQQVLPVDFHEFVRLAPLLGDTELANEFDLDVRQARALRARLTRG